MYKDIEKNIDKIIIAIVVLLIRYIRGFNKPKPHQQPPTTNQPNDEGAGPAGHFPLPQHKAQPLLRPIQSTIAATPPFQHRLTHVSNSIHRKLMVIPPYPGIKKLVLPTQEQNPYKLYQAAFSQKQPHLFRLLKKYHPTQQLVIMHEILTPKTSF